MAGTVDGGKKASITNKERYGEDFYRMIGKAGGAKSRGGGFSLYPEMARIYGAKGGRASRRGPSQ
jgi:general stress protein YciG